jgi:predicted DNA-binding protein
MSPSAKGQYNRHITIHFTQQTFQLLETLASHQKTSIGDLVRRAVHGYLEEHEDVMGSRSRLGRTVIGELEATQSRLVKQLNHMSALLLAAVILQQIQRGEAGGRVMEQIVQLAGQIEEHLPEATP